MKVCKPSVWTNILFWFMLVWTFSSTVFYNPLELTMHLWKEPEFCGWSMGSISIDSKYISPCFNFYMLYWTMIKDYGMWRNVACACEFEWLCAANVPVSALNRTLIQKIDDRSASEKQFKLTHRNDYTFDWTDCICSFHSYVPHRASSDPSEQSETKSHSGLNFVTHSPSSQAKVWLGHRATGAKPWGTETVNTQK
jgi:hypothetical protein